MQTTLTSGIGGESSVGSIHYQEPTALWAVGIIAIGALVATSSVLFAFVLVAGGILILRKAEPARPRPFRVPWAPWVPLAASASCGWLMARLPKVTWIRFLVWLGLGLVIYARYGMRQSRLGKTS